METERRGIEVKKMALGIIGGSGLYEIDGFEVVDKIKVETPFGNPSDPLVHLKDTNGTELYFLPRHGKGHRISPSEINYRANIYALKSVGVEWLLSVSAVGSLQEEVVPGHLVLPDQFFDRTYLRKPSFFEHGIVAHLPMANPVCLAFQAVVREAVVKADVPVHLGGTYVCIEGPQFSTKAESLFYRQLNAKVIGMTNMPEARLAREAELSYVPLSLATDYDCWRDEGDHVSLDAVMEVMKNNIGKAKKVIRALVEDFPKTLATKSSPFAGSVSGCIVTDPAVLDADLRSKYKLWLDQ